MNLTFKNAKSTAAKLLAVGVAAGSTVAANAAGADYSDLIAKADWTTAALGVVTIGGGLALVAVASTGVRKLLAMFRG